MQGAGGPDIVAAVDGILEVAPGNGRRYLSGREGYVGLAGLPVSDVEDVLGDQLGRLALPLPRRPLNSEWVGTPPWLQSGPRATRRRRRRAHLPLGQACAHRRLRHGSGPVWTGASRSTSSGARAPPTCDDEPARRSRCLAQGGAGRRREPDRLACRPLSPSPSGWPIRSTGRGWPTGCSAGA